MDGVLYMLDLAGNTIRRLEEENAQLREALAGALAVSEQETERSAPPVSA